MSLRITSYPLCRKVQIQLPNRKITQYYGKEKMLQISEALLENGNKEVINVSVDLVAHKVINYVKEILK